MINLSSLFLSNCSLTLKDFLFKLKDGEQDFFKIFNIPEYKFEDATFEELLSNESDVLSGVNRVQKNFSNLFFEIFDHCLLKHHDGGEIKLILYTITNSYKKVSQISDTLFTELGSGFYDDEKFFSFTDKPVVEKLCKGNYINQDIVNVWLYENLSILLQYKIHPFQQFSLMVSVKPINEIDRSIRRNGTILDLINIDINKILLESELEINEHVNDYGTKSTEYIARFLKPIAFKFDIIKIRLFGDSRFFNEDVQAHVTFMSSYRLSLEDKLILVEKLYRLYGGDNLGSGEIEFHEREILNDGSFWVGRNWTFNTLHSPWNMDNPDEQHAYSVMLDDFEDDEGFKLHIMGYNKLVKLFQSY